MKHILLSCAVALGISAFSNVAFSQNKYGSSFYSGNWEFEVKDVPQEVSGVLNFKPSGDSLSSYFVSGIDGDTIHVDKVNIADTSVTLYFTAMNQDITLTLHPQNDHQMDGVVMGMYPILVEKKND